MRTTQEEFDQLPDPGPLNEAAGDEVYRLPTEAEGLVRGSCLLVPFANPYAVRHHQPHGVGRPRLRRPLPVRGDAPQHVGALYDADPPAREEA